MACRAAWFVLLLLACGTPGIVIPVRSARVDPQLAIRAIATRSLAYSGAAPDRPAHVRAASGLAWSRGRLIVAQDDAPFLGGIAGADVDAIALPPFAIGDKKTKLDLEACVTVGDEVWAFGSGTTAARERIVVLAGDTPRVVDGAPLYRVLRAAIGGDLNIEGVASAGSELWLFQRGNTGPADTPAVVRFDRDAVARWLAGGATPPVLGVVRYDLGAIEGVRLGFTDAFAVGDRVFYLAAAEASSNAYDDGSVLGSQLGVIERERIRAAPLAFDGQPIKAEGLAFDPARPARAWIAIDPDDGTVPAQLLEIELVGPW